MRRKFNVLVLLFPVMFTSFSLWSQEMTEDHASWSGLLSRHVNEDGLVNYAGFLQDIKQLERYLNQLSENPPEKNRKKEEQLAYWINAYNAFTVKLILDHYPVKSIRDIDRPWERKFIRLGNGNYSLDQIEHEIIRKEFAEPRIHFALVCAAVSCPPLLNEAYTAEKLDEQLDRRAREFINDPEKNKISPSNIRISQIFNWFKDDFTKDGSLISYLNRYSETKIWADAEVEFMEYDWGLNGE